VLKLIFNIFVVYAIWQLIRMMFAVNKTQEKFHEKMRDMDRDMSRPEPKANSNKSKDKNEGEYIDYEEIK
jgi:predicted Holliday junction resolvase-like endonuclease